jgi:hypothetical protein
VRTKDIKIDGRIHSTVHDRASGWRQPGPYGSLFEEWPVWQLAVPRIKFKNQICANKNRFCNEFGKNQRSKWYDLCVEEDETFWGEKQ